MSLRTREYRSGGKDKLEFEGEDRKAQGQARNKVADKTRPLRVEIAQIDTRMAALAKERAQAGPAVAPAWDGAGDGEEAQAASRTAAMEGRCFMGAWDA